MKNLRVFAFLGCALPAGVLIAFAAATPLHAQAIPTPAPPTAPAVIGPASPPPQTTPAGGSVTPGPAVTPEPAVTPAPAETP